MLCETAALLSLYNLDRDESLLLYRLAEGRSMSDVSVELNKKESTLYEWCRNIQKKFDAKSFRQVMFLFGTCLEH